MPYITKGRRISLDRGLRQPTNAGELNYVLTREVLAYVRRKGLSYQAINDVLGVLSAVPREFYRRVAAPYEATKVEENGDLDWPT